MPQYDFVESFVAHLESLAVRDDRASLAKLRRGVGKRPGEAVELLPIVVPHLPRGADWAHGAMFLVAALFGMHPCVKRGDGIGMVLKRCGDNDSTEKRFMALLNAHPDDLPDHLRQAVSLARSKGAEIDYRRLLMDILRWGHPDRFVQEQWAMDFWGQARGQDKSEQA